MAKESLRDKILTLHEQGKTNAEISQIVGCTRANVTMTLKRASLWSHIVDPRLDIKLNDWLVGEASRYGISPSQLAHDLLTEAIRGKRSNG